MGTEAQQLTSDLEGLRARLAAFQRDSGQDVGDAAAFVQAAVLALGEAVPPRASTGPRPRRTATGTRSR